MAGILDLQAAIQSAVGQTYASSLVATGSGTPPAITISGAPSSGLAAAVLVVCTGAGPLGVWFGEIFYGGALLQVFTSASTIALIGAGDGLTLNVSAGNAATDNQWNAVLIPNVPVLLGRKETHRNLTYSAFFIVPRMERYTTPQGPGASGNPRLLHTRRFSFELHTWGKTYTDCEDLFAAFVTALRLALSGANYELGDAEWEEPEDLNLGVILATPITVVWGLAQKALPISVPLAQPAVADNTAPAAIITSTGLDNTGAVAGDGVLTSGEG